MKISFIVPVYGVELYLRQCVESITKQDYRNIEVILVDDESPDGCPALCEELALEDDRVKVVHQLHGGLSKARNTGLEYVTGEYLMYVDSDDYLVCGDGLINRLVEKIRRNACPDFLCLNHYLKYGGRLKKHEVFDDALCIIKSRDSLLRKMVLSGNLMVNAWNKLLRVDFVREQGLCFFEGVVSEDNPWFIDLLDKAETFLFVNEYSYVYRYLRPGSITSSFSLFYFDSVVNNIKHNLLRFDGLRFREESRIYLLSYVAVNYCSCVARINRLPKNVRRQKWEELKTFSYLMDYDKYPKVRLVNRFRKIFGLEITKSLLQFYDRIRTLAQSRI